jgi:2-polyprenyl-6-methoxyphenol hydroxylase-like FAD-dependent oxidoreductase
MTQCVYDLAIIGGGLGGAALAAAMARRGSRVLVVEREEAFKDRVRGEGLLRDKQAGATATVGHMAHSGASTSCEASR